MTVAPLRECGTRPRWPAVGADGAPAEARDLFHLSAAMWDAWAAYDPTARGYFLTEKHTAAESSGPESGHQLWRLPASPLARRVRGGRGGEPSSG